MTIRKCGSARKKRCVFRSAGRPPPYDKLVLVGSFNTADKQATRLMEKLKKMAPVTLPNRTFLPTPFTSYSLDGALAGSAVDILTSRPGFEVLKINTTTPGLLTYSPLVFLTSTLFLRNSDVGTIDNSYGSVARYQIS